MSKLIDQLRGGDFRTNARAKKLVARVLRRPELLKEIVQAASNDDPLVRMRAADILETVSRTKSDLLQPYKHRILNQLTTINQQEVRWHVAQMLPRLQLTAAERRRAWKMLAAWYADKDEHSKIVKTFSLQGMYELSLSLPALRKQTLTRVQQALRSPAFAIKTRARHILVDEAKRQK